MTITPEQLLAEVEDILRTMPQENAFQVDSPEIFSWLGRAQAIVGLWDPYKGASFNASVTSPHSNMAEISHRAYREVCTMLNLAWHDLRLKTVGPLTVALGPGAVFDYFDEVRKIIHMGKNRPAFC